jgi:glycosyltransferase involved in cell wall biosynthesis
MTARSHRRPVVDVAVCGAFHAVALANELEKRGLLGTFHTSYPASYLPKRFGSRLPSERVRSNWIQFPIEVVTRLRGESPEPTWWLRQLHDRLVADRLEPGIDIFVGWSGCSLRSIRKAKSLGAKTVVVRGSAHIDEQLRILSTEYKRLGLAFLPPLRTAEMERQEYAEADFIQTNSTFAAQTFIDRGAPAEKLLCVNTGVDLRRFRRVDRTDHRFRVVTCGGLGIRKGTHHLIEAFRRAKLPGAELLLIGPILPELEEILLSANEPAIRAIGPQPNADLHRWFSQCDVFVLPSLEEGLAAVLSQAMSCALPIVCTPNTGGADLLSADGVEGFLAQAGDVDALAEHLQWFFEHQDAAREMGMNAETRAQRALTWETYGSRIADAYVRIARTS